MKTHCAGDTLVVSGIKELDAATARALRQAVSTAWSDELKYIEIDLAETVFMDSFGLGALVWLRKLVADRNGRVRLLNPVPSTEQILALTRLYRVFDIVRHRPAVAREGASLSLL